TGKNRCDDNVRIPAILMNDAYESFSRGSVLMSLHRSGDMQPAPPKSGVIDLDRFFSQQRDSVRQLGMGLFFSHRRRPIVALTLEKPRQQVGKKIGRLREC